MELLLILSREHETLPKAEVMASLEGECLPYTIKCWYDGILILDSADKDLHVVDVMGKRLAFTHEICKFLFKTAIENFKFDVERYPWENVVDDDYAVRVKKINPHADLDSQAMEWEIGAIIKKKLKDAKVNLEDPSTFIRVVVTGKKVFFGIRIIKIDKKHFFNLKPHKRPFFHPGSLHPKLARCMVNLSRVKKMDVLLDPFCGTGGILIEAGIIGTRLFGVDIDEEMVNGTIENLRFCGIDDYMVFQGDARNIKIPEKVDAIVTDPPYGISASTAGEEGEKLYKEALSSMQKIIKKKGHICIATPHYMNIHKLVKGTKLKIIEQHKIRMHKSLTRVISVLKKS